MPPLDARTLDGESLVLAEILEEAETLMARAEEKGVKSLAFPPIGTGLYQVPLDLCTRVMVDTITKRLENGSTLEEVVIVAPLFERRAAGVQPHLGGPLEMGLGGAKIHQPYLAAGAVHDEVGRFDVVPVADGQAIALHLDLWMPLERQCLR